MEVFRALFGLALVLFVSACSNVSSVDSKFQSQNSAFCVNRRIENKFLVTWEDGRVTVERGTDLDSFKEDFIRPQLDQIRKFEFDHKIQLSDQTSTQVEAAATTDSWGQTMVQASDLWNKGYKGQNVLVGVVDSVVDTTHPQLASHIVAGPSFISNPGTNPTMNSHGTHVSGIIAADPSQGSIQGMAPSAKIVPAPFISNDGSGDLGDAIRALEYVASQGVKVINASWGGAGCNTALADEFAKLSSQGILLVVAAGNSGVDIDYKPEYPAAYSIPTQITVAAATSLDLMANWSNSGFTSVHIAAPGARILSTVPYNGTSYMDGTSMAAPFIAGAAALLWSAKPRATAANIREALLKSVDVTPQREYKVSSQGRLNVAKALTELQKIVP